MLQNRREEDFEVFNIGTGNGNSILEAINTFERVNDVKVPYRIRERRGGDAEKNYADATKANKGLERHAELNLADMVRDAWCWENLLEKQPANGNA